MSKANIERATVNILIELNGEVHLAAMERDKLDAISWLTKASAETLIKTGKTQTELREFLGVKG